MNHVTTCRKDLTRSGHETINLPLRKPDQAPRSDTLLSKTGRFVNRVFRNSLVASYLSERIRCIEYRSPLAGLLFEVSQFSRCG
jgi:hypothetical protein